MKNFLNIADATVLALHAAVLLAKHTDRPLTTQQLAQTMHASADHLAKVMHRLTENGIASAQRGPGGGFVLAKAPAKLTMLDVYEAMEGRHNPEDCLLGLKKCSINRCIVGDMLSDINDIFLRTMAMTLERAAKISMDRDVK